MHKVIKGKKTGPGKEFMTVVPDWLKIAVER